MENNRIVITGKESWCTFVSGSILHNGFERVAIAAKWEQKTPRSVLKHEFGHYLRVALEDKDGGDENFTSIKSLLFHRYKIPSRYLCCLSSIWSNTEELNEIYGIRYNEDTDELMYDYLNESEFNLAENGRVRYGHKQNFFPRIPYLLFTIFERKGALPIENQQEIPYNETIDSI